MGYLGNTPALNFISFAKQVFTIVNSQTAYTLDHKVTNENDIRLVINNVVQEPGSGKAYTASGNTLTLSSALVNGTDEMYCVFLGKAVQTVNAPNASVGSDQTASTIITGQTAETSIATDDTILIHDTSASALRKMTRANFVSGIGGNNQPYFTAYQAGNYSISHNTNTNIVLTSTTVNSGSAYSTSNGRFTPQVAGDYFCQFTFSARHGSSGNAVVLFESHITKNGSVVFQASSGNEATSTVGQSVSSMSGIITFNGSSDYINAMVYQYDYTGNAAQNINEIQFSAFKMI
mgnify:CR=1 FL=1